MRTRNRRSRRAKPFDAMPELQGLRRSRDAARARQCRAEMRRRRAALVAEHGDHATFCRSASQAAMTSRGRAAPPIPRCLPDQPASAGSALHQAAIQLSARPNTASSPAVRSAPARHTTTRLTANLGFFDKCTPDDDVTLPCAAANQPASPPQCFGGKSIRRRHRAPRRLRLPCGRDVQWDDLLRRIERSAPACEPPPSAELRFRRASKRRQYLLPDPRVQATASSARRAVPDGTQPPGQRCAPIPVMRRAVRRQKPNCACPPGQQPQGNTCIPFRSDATRRSSASSRTALARRASSRKATPASPSRSDATPRSSAQAELRLPTGTAAAGQYLRPDPGPMRPAVHRHQAELRLPAGPAAARQYLRPPPDPMRRAVHRHQAELRLPAGEPSCGQYLRPHAGPWPPSPAQPNCAAAEAQRSNQYRARTRPRRDAVHRHMPLAARTTIISHAAILRPIPAGDAPFDRH